MSDLIEALRSSAQDHITRRRELAKEHVRAGWGAPDGGMSSMPAFSGSDALGYLNDWDPASDLDLAEAEVAAAWGELAHDLRWWRQAAHEGERREKALEAEADRLRSALVEVDTYLASDPQIWRLTAAAKAGDVLCDVLGADTIQRINAAEAS